MTSMKNSLLQLFIVFSVLALIFFFAFLSRTPEKNQAEEEMIADNMKSEKLQDDKEALSPTEEVYGFAIGNFHKAYRVSDFLEKGPIYDTLAGEGVLVSRTSTGEVIMTHSDTGEVFIPVKTTWSSWVALYPDTLLYKNE